MPKEFVMTKVGEQKIKLTNLNKILYPSVGILKAEVVQYYLQMAPYMLKHVSHRPLSLIRFPDGIGGTTFYAKDKPEWAPDWIKSVAYGRESPKDYILANDAASLTWLANLAALEIHPMQVKTPELKYPDSIIFDLDPPNAEAFYQVKEIAFSLRAFLLDKGYFPLVKLSGSKGLHVIVPILEKWDEETIVETSKTLAKDFIKTKAKTTTLKMRKEARKGKLLIDIYRNHRGQTAVGAYSLRGREGAPVSAPVSWEELEEIESSKHFNLKSMLKRVQEKGDIWSGFKEYAVKLHNKTFAVDVETESLEKYKNKRNFTKTSEPSAEISHTDGMRFVIQRHHATNAHYDLRLEKDGVLKSWAIPKGIPRQKGVKRLAVQTEDHPVKYLDFEGTIPKGEYGGGEMWVFDSGTYTIKEYTEKKIKFSLQAKHLNGEYSMYKAGEKNWLIERKDDASRSIMDMKMEHMLADQRKDVPTGEKYIFEVKWDGIRVMIYKLGSQIKIISRNGRDISKQFPDVIEHMDNFKSEEVILDGEIICNDAQKKPDFKRVISRLHTSSLAKIESSTKTNPAICYLFDCLWLDGKNICKEALHKRRAWLKECFKQSTQVRFSAEVTEGKMLFKLAKEQGLEGIMVKDKNGLYFPGQRTDSWKKIKYRSTVDCFIIGYTEGSGDRSPYFGSLHLAEQKGEEWIYRGRVGTGFDHKKVQEIKKILDQQEEGKKCVDAQTEEEKKTTWIVPQLMVEIEYASMTHNGTLREPVFKKFIVLNE